MTRLKQHSFTPFHRSVVLQITNKCPFSCKSCSQKLSGEGEKFLLLSAIEKNITSYVSTPVPRHGRPEVTLLGGAAETHPDYLQIVKLLSGAHPKQLDLYLQYYYARPEFAQLVKIIKGANTPVNFVFSCDRMHASGWHSMHKWAESALEAFLGADFKPKILFSAKIGSSAKKTAANLINEIAAYNKCLAYPEEKIICRPAELLDVANGKRTLHAQYSILDVIEGNGSLSILGERLVNFVFSSTQFSQRGERETDAFFNRLRREFGDCFEVKYWQGMRLKDIRKKGPLPSERFLNIAPDGKIYLSAKAQARGVPAEKELNAPDLRGINPAHFDVLRQPLEKLMDALQWSWRQGV